MTQVIVRDLRAARLCLQGARSWFARHGLDWQLFLREGCPAETLAATGDALAMRAIAEAERRLAREQDQEQSHG